MPSPLNSCSDRLPIDPRGEGQRPAQIGMFLCRLSVPDPPISGGGLSGTRSAIHRQRAPCLGCPPAPIRPQGGRPVTGGRPPTERGATRQVHRTHACIGSGYPRIVEAQIRVSARIPPSGVQHRARTCRPSARMGCSRRGASAQPFTPLLMSDRIPPHKSSFPPRCLRCASSGCARCARLACARAAARVGSAR